MLRLLYHKILISSFQKQALFEKQWLNNCVYKNGVGQ